MDRDSSRVIVYALIFLLVYWAYRNGSIQGGRATRIIDAVSGAPVTPDEISVLNHVQQSLGTRGGIIQ